MKTYLVLAQKPSNELVVLDGREYYLVHDKVSLECEINQD
jgi:hypothetical protein